MSFAARKIIFDLDGTLVDTAPDLLAATNHVLNGIGRNSVSLNQVRHMVGFGAMHLIELGLKATGGTGGQNLADLLNKFLTFYASNIAVSSKPFEGVLPVLNQLLSEGYSLGVCTNKPEKLATALLNELKLSHYFGVVVGGDSLPYKKPDPRPILYAANALPGTGPIVMVGDSRADIDGAKAAKVHSILVTFGYSAEDHHELYADKVITAWEALPACLTLAAT